MHDAQSWAAPVARHAAATERAPSETASDTARSVTTRHWQTINADLEVRRSKPYLIEVSLTSKIKKALG